MLVVRGTYKKGKFLLEEKVKADKSIDVVVTFLDEETQVQKLDWNLFSFDKARELTKNIKLNLSDVIIEERKNEK